MSCRAAAVVSPVLVALALCAGNLALAADLPRLVLLPVRGVEGVSDHTAARFNVLLLDELRARDADFRVLPTPAPMRAPSRTAASPRVSRKDAAQALAQGKKLLRNFQFKKAVSSLERGIELSLSDPGTADFEQVLEAYLGIAVSYFRIGREKQAQSALLAVVRLRPDYKLPLGYPPAFGRELERARTYSRQLANGTLTIDAPLGSSAWLNGRPLGKVPVSEEKVAVGTHYVRVEGPRGERFAQAVEVVGSSTRVQASFSTGSGASSGVPELSSTLDADAVSRLDWLCKTTGADYVLVGALFPAGEGRLSVGAALFSAYRRGFQPMPAFSFDAQLVSASVKVLELVDRVAVTVRSFGVPAPLPVELLAARPAEPQATASGPQAGGQGGPPKLVLPPPRDESSNPVNVGAGPGPAGPAPAVGSGSGDVLAQVPWWVWAAGAGALAAAAGGTAYGIYQSRQPATGTVMVRW